MIKEVDPLDKSLLDIDRNFNETSKRTKETLQYYENLQPIEEMDQIEKRGEHL